MPNIIPNLRASSDELRDAAVKTVEALATRCAESATLRSVFADTFKAIAGAELPQRISLLSALGALANSPAAPSFPDAASQLAGFAAREPTDEAKTAALNALARWLRLQKDLHPEARKRKVFFTGLLIFFF